MFQFISSSSLKLEKSYVGLYKSYIFLNWYSAWHLSFHLYVWLICVFLSLSVRLSSVILFELSEKGPFTCTFQMDISLTIFTLNLNPT